MTINVAYADDHLATRQGIIAFLERLGGIDVTIQASNGLELIKLLEKSKSVPDVIILDINMPQMDGFETLQVLKERWPDIGILVLTAFETELYLIRMIEMGANGYLLKNCHPQEIKQALASINTNGYYYADAQSRSFYDKVRRGEIKLPHFSDNESTFLKYCPTDLSYSEIAEKMETTIKALDGYSQRLCEKLHVKGRIGLAMCAIQLGFAQSNIKLEPENFIIHKKKTRL